MAIHCIYILKSKIKPYKCYIGSAIDFMSRRRQHFSCLRLRKHPNTILQNHCNKYGIDDLTIEIIEEINDTGKLIEREQFYIDLINPIFNICKKANSSLGVKRTELTIQKLKKCKNALGVKRTPETLDRMRISMIGKNKAKHTKEHIENNRLSMIGKNSKKVIDTKTGNIYKGVMAAAESVGLKYSTLRSQLGGKNKNSTYLKYLP
jgi:group I intron endonuclease